MQLVGGATLLRICEPPAVSPDDSNYSMPNRKKKQQPSSKYGHYYSTVYHPNNWDGTEYLLKHNGPDCCGPGYIILLLLSERPILASLCGSSCFHSNSVSAVEVLTD